MERAEALSFVEGCIHDDMAPCSCACPFNVDIRSILKKVARGRLSAAYREFRTATVFPSVAAYLCDRPCRERCQRKFIGDEALDMERLEEAVLRLAGQETPDVFQASEKEERIAVVGAGPAGLSAALNMAQKNYKVTVFETSDDLGGSLKDHEKFDVFKEDILFQFSKETVDFQYNHKIETLDELKDYTAVYITTGEGGCDFGLKDSWDPESLTTKRPLTFMGGGVCGMTLMGAVAAGPLVSKYMESAIQTGNALSAVTKRECHEHKLVPEGAVRADKVVPADPDAGYTKAEAKEEAGRCWQCTCDACLTGCELFDKYRKAPQQAAMEVFTDSGAHFLASRTMTREVYSCNICGRCQDRCPESIDMGALFQFSRKARVEEGIQPPAFHDFWLRELDSVSTECFYAAPPKGKTTCEYAFFPGCQLTASLPEQTVSTYKWLAEKYDAGVVLGCCGASAWWAGEEEKWEENSALLRSTWKKLGEPVFVIACATCQDMLKRLTPEIPTVSLYTLMAKDGGVQTANCGPAHAAVFDPCASRGQNDMRDGIRKLAQSFGCETEELKDPGKCCGWGGHMRTANPAMYQTIAGNRVSESKLPYIVYCANCREVFKEQGKECRHILELAFGACDKIYTIREKRINRLNVKKELMLDMEGTGFEIESRPFDDIEVNIPDDVLKAMETALISEDDVKECIYEARLNNTGFVDQDGIHLACLKKRVLTYWVEYIEGENGVCAVKSAYCHRMTFGGAENG